MQNNPAHINYGFYYGDERPPAQAPGDPPPYYPAVPLYSNTAPAPAPVLPINTHHTITSGQPHTTAARKGTRVEPCFFYLIYFFPEEFTRTISVF